METTVLRFSETTHWLLDPETQTAHVYRPGQPVEEKPDFAGPSLSGKTALPGFTRSLDLLR